MLAKLLIKYYKVWLKLREMSYKLDLAEYLVMLSENSTP
jgi:hypothetical protein